MQNTVVTTMFHSLSLLHLLNDHQCIARSMHWHSSLHPNDFLRVFNAFHETFIGIALLSALGAGQHMCRVCQWNISKCSRMLYTKHVLIADACEVVLFSTRCLAH